MIDEAKIEEAHRLLIDLKRWRQQVKDIESTRRARVAARDKLLWLVGAIEDNRVDEGLASDLFSMVATDIRNKAERNVALTEKRLREIGVKVPELN